MYMFVLFLKCILYLNRNVVRLLWKKETDNIRWVIYMWKKKKLIQLILNTISTFWMLQERSKAFMEERNRQYQVRDWYLLIYDLASRCIIYTTLVKHVKWCENGVFETKGIKSACLCKKIWKTMFALIQKLSVC